MIKSKIVLLSALVSCALISGCKEENKTNVSIEFMHSSVKRRTKNAKTFHDKCENFTFRASNETAALTAVFLFIKWDHFGYG